MQKGDLCQRDDKSMLEVGLPVRQRDENHQDYLGQSHGDEIPRADTGYLRVGAMRAD